MATVSKRRRWGRVLLGAVLLMSGCALCNNLMNVTVPQVERKLDKELPLGSTRAEVENWLKAQHLGEGHYTKWPIEYYGATITNEVPDVSVYSGEIVSIIRDTDKSLLVTGSIQLRFLFGHDDRLARRLVYMVYTGM